MMRKKRRFMWIIYVLASIVIIVIAIKLFIAYAPQFGGKMTEELEAKYGKSPNFKNGQFQNLEKTVMEMDFKTGLSTMKDFITKGDIRKPKEQIQMAMPDLQINESDVFKITWFGHSTAIIQVSGKTILLDPMLGESPSPVGILSPSRFWDTLPQAIESLPKFDAIIISHDHYDHLDYETVQKLAQKTDAFYMPLAVGRHLVRWNIPEEKIHELDWWDEVIFDKLTFICAPSRHFSGRGTTDRNTTLWCSWIIKSPQQKLYFSGDGGYGKHFKQIGEKYGPFDFALIECGQYDKRWAVIHMLPEESVQASIDIQANAVMPIHWGAFSLGLHSWQEPVLRFLAKAKEENVTYATPRIGQSFMIDSLPNSEWYLRK